MNSIQDPDVAQRPVLVRALWALAFGVATAVVTGAGIIGGLLVGLWIGVPVGIFVGVGIMVSVPTAFVVLSRRFVGIPKRPGLTLLWLLVALCGALLVQLISGRLLAVAENPYVSPLVVAVIVVFIASAGVSFVGPDPNGDERRG